MASERDRDANVGATESVATSRRSFLLIAGAASCVVLTGGAVGALAPQHRRIARQSKETARHSLVDHVRAGAVMHTSTVAEVRAVRLGAVAVVMRRADGTAFQLDLLRRSERDGSIARSAHYSVFAVNGGTGTSATSESDGLAAMALARAVSNAERNGMAPVALLTHADRARQHPDGAFRVPV